MRGLLPILGVLASGFLILWTAGAVFFAVGLLSYKPPSTALKSDAIIVLTGGPQRINEGLDLLATGTAPDLFISGVDGRVTIEKLTEIWGKSSVNAPVPCCIVLGRKARNTRENAREVRMWTSAKNVKTIRLVTAGYHIPRAVIEFSAAMPDINIFPHPVDTARMKPGLVFSEYNKTLFTSLRLFWERLK